MHKLKERVIKYTENEDSDPNHRKKILDVITTNPLLTHLHGFTYGICADSPEPYK